MMHLCIMLHTHWTTLLMIHTVYRPPLDGPKIALDGMGSARIVLKSWLRACPLLPLAPPPAPQSPPPRVPPFPSFPLPASLFPLPASLSPPLKRLLLSQVVAKVSVSISVTKYATLKNI